MGRNPAQRFRTPSLRCDEQNRKIFLTFFNCVPQKIFQLSKRKIFCFDILLIAELRKRSHPCPPSAGRAGGQKFLPPDPLPFCPPAWVSS